jgi:peptidoglycan/xylan/chitin deacetylase (PgdA/CDA1 family)
MFKNLLCFLLSAIAVCGIIWGFLLINLGDKTAGVSAELLGESADEMLTADKVPLPIVMYHKVSKTARTKYSVTVEQLESDFRAFCEAGYTTVFMRDVINWIDGRGNLPKKPLVITFDDGQYNNLSYVLPIAQKYGVKYMICPVTSFSQNSIEHNDTGNPNYSHLSWDDMKTANESGLVEIGNHTHKMHKFKPRYGIGKMGSETVDDYLVALRDDIEQAQNLIANTGTPKPTSFAYPFGKYTREGRELLVNELGFRALLTCNERVTMIERGKAESLHELGRFNRSGNYSTETIMGKI